MNTLSRDQQIAILSAITEGMSLRATARITGLDRKTVARLALRVGRGCAELHDRMMVGVRAGRLELDELWAFIRKKQKRVKRTDSAEFGDAYTRSLRWPPPARPSFPISPASAIQPARTCLFRTCANACSGSPS